MKSDRRLTADGDCRRGKLKRLYAIYAGILSRCNNPNRNKYKNYGGRGIKCEFVSYLDFKEWALHSGYSDVLSIERLDVDGNYSRSNCTWIPIQDQVYNKTSNKLFNINPEVLKQKLIQASGIYGAMTNLAAEFNCSLRSLYNYKSKLGVNVG